MIFGIYSYSTRDGVVPSLRIRQNAVTQAHTKYSTFLVESDGFHSQLREQRPWNDPYLWGKLVISVPVVLKHTLYLPFILHCFVSECYLNHGNIKPKSMETLNPINVVVVVVLVVGAVCGVGAAGDANSVAISCFLTILPGRMADCFLLGNMRKRLTPDSISKAARFTKKRDCVSNSRRGVGGEAVTSYDFQRNGVNWLRGTTRSRC